MSRIICIRNVAIAVLCGVAAGSAYWLTLAPGITWRNGGGDSGELVTAAYYLGVAHPAGYPLYVLLGWLATHLPLADVAYRANLLSAVCASVAIVLCFVVLLDALSNYQPFARTMGSVAGALLLAFSPLFWSQAVVAEVYSLLAAMLFLTLWAQERMVKALPSRGPVLLTGLVLGLGAADHLTLLLVAPGVIVRLISLCRAEPRLLLTQACIFGAGLLLGLSSYLLLFVFGHTAPSFATWGATTTFDNWWTHVSGAAYRPAVFSLPLTVVLTRVPALARFVLEQFGWLGYGFALLGWWVLGRDARGFAVSLGVSAALFLTFALDYPVLNSQVYLLGFFLLMTPAIGHGVATCVQTVMGRAQQRSLATGGVVLSVLVMLLASFVTSKPKVDMSGDDGAHQFARDTLAAVPAGALLLTRTDDQTFSLWYLEYVEGFRRDVAVVDTRLLAWPWYQGNVAATYPGLTIPCLHCYPLWEVPALVLANASQRSAYATFSEIGLPFVKDGQLYRYDPTALSVPRTR